MAVMAFTLVREFIDVVWNAGRTVRVGDFIHPDYAVDGTMAGPSWIADNVIAYRTAFPDLVVTIDSVAADGGRVVTLLRLQGTHRDPWKGVPGIGHVVDYREAAFWTMSEGRIIAGAFVAESLALRVQLGQVPAAVWSGRRLQEQPDA